jgi:hypothetical protein
VIEHGHKKALFANWKDGRSQEKSVLSDQCEVQVGMLNNRGRYLTLLLHRLMCNQFFIHDLLNLLHAFYFLLI